MAEYTIITQYVKEFNFKSPIFKDVLVSAKNTKSNIRMEVHVAVKALNENPIFEVSLHTNIFNISEKEEGELSENFDLKQVNPGDLIFSLETIFDAIVEIPKDLTKNKDNLERILLIDVPSFLFPQIRLLASHFIREAGYNIDQIQPIDFKKIHLDNKKESEKENFVS